LLTSTLVLAAPRLNLSFTLQVDDSHVGAGAVLLQADVGLRGLFNFQKVEPLSVELLGH
jgi:hypothetical protein